MRTLADYLCSLLPSPFKRIKGSGNHFKAFCHFAGILLEEGMQQLFTAREQGKIITCAPELLPEHGRDRSLPRLEGENAEAYRDRLIVYFDIASKAGTTTGIQLAIQALGYNGIELEPVRPHDATRWAEFFVWIGSEADTGAINMATLDRQIGIVKKATSMPAYGILPNAVGVNTGAYSTIGMYLTIDPYIPENIATGVTIATYAYHTAAARITLLPS